jgi:hypothetical protein
VAHRFDVVAVGVEARIDGAQSRVAALNRTGFREALVFTRSDAWISDAGCHIQTVILENVDVDVGRGQDRAVDQRAAVPLESSHERVAFASRRLALVTTKSVVCVGSIFPS